MAIHLGTTIVALIFFGISFIIRRRCEIIARALLRPFRQEDDKLRDEKNQAFANHGLRSAQKQSEYTPTPTTQAKPYHMTMGLKRLDMENWLTVDAEYTKEHQLRTDLLDKSLPSVFQCLSGSEVACLEVLQLVVDFLTSRYPEMFVLEGSNIYNNATGETFSLVDVTNPLEIAARLAMEDFNILTKDESDGQFHLVASVTLFPVGWKLQERIGGSMAELHKTVPKWQERLSCPIAKYFTRLSPTSTMERLNTFVQTTPELFLTDALPSDPTAFSPFIPPSSIILRTERQTFRRLPISDAVLFTVHTYKRALTDLSSTELQDFVQEIRGWPEETARYKGRDYWGVAVEKYARERQNG